MSDRRWRGTLLYAGALAVMGSLGVARFAGADAVVAAPADDPPSSATDDSTPDGAASPTATDDPTADPTSPTATDEGTPASGAVTVTGDAVQTRYGVVQTAVTVDAGAITSVQVLQEPDREQRSAEINDRALPILEQEVVAAGSADVDTVSGATYTSAGYLESVQSALDQVG